ncbi:MAG: APC family permease [Thermoprotei archaeon]|jgi:amino acid transporter
MKYIRFAMGEAAPPTVFVRRASGLVRTIGPFTAFMLVFSHTVGGGIHKLSVIAAYNNPGADIALSFLILGLIAAIPTALVYTLLGSLMPRTGGDYIFTTRGLNPAIGFLASWGFWFTEVLSYGIIAWYSIDFFATAFTSAGIALNDPGYINIAKWLASTEGHWVIGLLLVFLFGLLALLGMRIYGLIVSILGTIAVIGCLSNIAILAGKTPEMAAAGWDAVFGSGTYNAIIKAAFNLTGKPAVPYVITPFNMTSTINAGVAAIWAYIGITAAVYAGGELKNPSRTLVIAQVLGTLLIIAYYITLPYLVYSIWTVPKSRLDELGVTPLLSEAKTPIPPDQVKFNTLYQYVYNNLAGGNVTKLPELGINFHTIGGMIAAPPPGIVTPYVISLVPGSAPIQIFNAVTVGIVLLKDIPAFFVVSSRMVFAWAFDRFFPELFAAVNEMFHSPHWAVILTMIGGFAGVVLNILSGEWLASVDTTMLYQVAVMFTSLAAILLPWVRRDLYEKGARWEIAGIPILTIVGLIAFPVNFYFLIVAGAWLNILKDLVLQSTWMGFGALIFIGFMIYNYKRGIDVRTIYAEIPPA